MPVLNESKNAKAQHEVFISEKRNPSDLFAERPRCFFAFMKSLCGSVILKVHLTVPRTSNQRNCYYLRRIAFELKREGGSSPWVGLLSPAGDNAARWFRRKCYCLSVTFLDAPEFFPSDLSSECCQNEKMKRYLRINCVLTQTAFPWGLEIRQKSVAKITIVT